ncbi:MAG: carboxypeptidase M32 [Treponema sp.]|nr:carboxypeptidase M32 [Treponema sp.]
MEKEIENNIKIVHKILDEAQKYEHACKVLNYDLETICPAKGMEEQGNLIAFLSNQAFKLKKSEEFEKASQYLIANINKIEDLYDRSLVKILADEYDWNKNLTSEKQKEFSSIYNKAYVDWINAKQKSDFSLFEGALQNVKKVENERIELRLNPEHDKYDNLLDSYERGITSADLDRNFEKCKERLIPLLQKIMKSKKKIRRDFLNREVSDEQQKKMAEELLKTIAFDFERGAFTTTEHPFMDDLAQNDVRVTTHYYPNNFASSMYSIIHEGGHALFGQNVEPKCYEHHIQGNMTLGMHESVSRFYENRIGRSKEFIHLIYPKVIEFFPQIKDVSENELYEALNIVEPSLIRTEADEFTYSFHIIIRYEIEKMIMDGKVEIKDLPKVWNEKYKEYLGIEPSNDKEGVLQDVHWSSGFGYFPTYALGNMYNAMYYNSMIKDFDLKSAIRTGDFNTINSWMKNHVWKKANLLAPKEWIKDITGREFTCDDFLDYLECKYSEIYEL